MEKNYEDRVKIVNYYWNILEKEASNGRVETSITAEMIENAPTLTSTGRRLPFGFVANELRERGCEVDGEVKEQIVPRRMVDGQAGDWADDQPPYRVRVVDLYEQSGMDDFHIQEQLLDPSVYHRRDLHQYVRKTTIESHEVPAKTASSLAERTKEIRTKDYEKIAAHIIDIGCIPRCEIGYDFLDIDRDTVGILPKMRNGSTPCIIQLKEFIAAKGYTVKMNDSYLADGAEGTDDKDLAFTVSWG